MRAPPITFDELTARSTSRIDDRPTRPRRCGRSSSASTCRLPPTQDAASALAGRSSTDGEAALLHVFADLCALAPERRPVDGPDEQRVPREHFNQYLRSLDAEREGIPTWFVERLERAVAHYGVDSLAVTPELEDALMRIFIAQQRDRRTARRRHDDPREPRRRRPATAPTIRLRDALDRVIEATQRRHPALASIARGVRHRLFDRPLIDRHRDAVATEMRQHVLRLAGPRRSDGRRGRTTRRRSSPARCRSLRCSSAAGCSPTTDRPGAAAQRADAPLLQDPRPRPGRRSSASTGSTSPRREYRRHDRSVAVLSVTVVDRRARRRLGGRRRSGCRGRSARTRRSSTST